MSSSICGVRTPVLVALLLVLLASGCTRAGGEAFQPSLNTALTLAEDTTLGQSFNPVGDSVRAVDLHVATFAAAADPAGVLTVALVDADSGAVLDTAQVAGADLADASWVRADFGQPVDVADVAVVEVSWRGATPLALWANTPQDDVSLVNDPYPHGQLVRDGVPAEGDLAFRVVSGAGPTAGIGQVVEVSRSAGARLVDAPVFTVLWGLALLGSAALAVTGLRRGADPDDPIAPADGVDAPADGVDAPADGIDTRADGIDMPDAATRP